MKKKVFIIGNGFDLDLGWKTRYSDFASSKFWIGDSYGSDLKSRLNQDKNIEKWFDQEMSLLNYAKADETGYHPSPYEYTKERDMQCFNELNKGLSSYLKAEENKSVNEKSVAAKVLRGILSNGYFTSIYSFNYTNLKSIAGKLGLSTDFRYEHVHGSIATDSIILGVEDAVDLYPGYSFLYKTFSPHYESHHIQYDLLEADEVVFFGHSLGKNDYHYFQSFFRRQCDESLERKQGKRITFFTYDDASRIGMLEQLREMNDKKTNYLFGLNDMEFICTKGGCGNKLKQFLQRMNLESRSADARRLEGILGR